jgi:hypothetical protein
MRNMTVLRAGCLLAAWIALNAATAWAQAVQSPPATGYDVRVAYTAYPYGHPCLPHQAYRNAVRYGFVPVAPPPTLFHGPTYHYGCPFYGPPYYAYPTPPLACPGYAGFSGTNPHAYRTMVPPPIPTSLDSLPNAQPTPAPAPGELPALPTPNEPIPAPPSEPGTK